MFISERLRSWSIGAANGVYVVCAVSARALIQTQRLFEAHFQLKSGTSSNTYYVPCLLARIHGYGSGACATRRGRLRYVMAPQYGAQIPKG